MFNTVSHAKTEFSGKVMTQKVTIREYSTFPSHLHIRLVTARLCELLDLYAVAILYMYVYCYFYQVGTPRKLYGRFPALHQVILG